MLPSLRYFGRGMRRALAFSFLLTLLFSLISLVHSSSPLESTTDGFDTITVISSSTYLTKTQDTHNSHSSLSTQPNNSNPNKTVQTSRIVDDHLWATDAITPKGLKHLNLPGTTAAPISVIAYNGYGKPHWTSNFSLTYPLDSVNQINVTYLPFTPDNYTVTLTEGVDYLVHPNAKIELLTSLDLPIINEHWVDGVNNTVIGYSAIGHIATGIQSVYVKFPNGTERFARNYGYMMPPPSEWWFDPDWPWELAQWYVCGHSIWPAGSEWWVNYTAASYLTIDYNAFAPPVVDAIVDIFPDALNLLSQGTWFFCNIELPKTYNACNIAVSSIRLNNTIPVNLAAPVEIGDYDNDNASDLMIAFNRTELIEYVISKGVTYGNITLTLAGKLHKIGSFNGSVTLKVSSLIGDVNCDKIVDISDIILASKSYHTKEDEIDWNSNANFAPPWDKVDIFDLVTVAYHYGEEYTP